MTQNKMLEDKVPVTKINVVSILNRPGRGKRKGWGKAGVSGYVFKIFQGSRKQKECFVWFCFLMTLVFLRREGSLGEQPHLGAWV
jgi:hypothetical protein